MNKKLLVAAIAVATAAASTSAFAATKLGGATQKGSLLIFPRVETLSGGHDRRGPDVKTDTLISITNDSSYPVNLQCYWGTTDQGTADSAQNNTTPANGALRTAIRTNHYADFSFVLTKNQPVSFWAGDLSDLANGVANGSHGLDRLTTYTNAPQFNLSSDSAGSNVGELKCWAVDRSGTKEVHHNHLSGKAMVATFDRGGSAHEGQAHEYNAWAFQAHYYDKKQAYAANNINYTGKILPTPGALNLDGKEYDQCPSVLLGQFIPTGRPLVSADSEQDGNNRRVTSTQISVANCHEDLRQDAESHITKLTYTTWGKDEIKHGGAHECMGAWYEADLGDKFSQFQYKTIKTDSAYFRAVPTASNKCNQNTATGGNNQKGAPDSDIEVSSVVGVQVSDVGGRFQTSSNLVGLGNGTTYANETAGKGLILWDSNGASDLGKQ